MENKKLKIKSFFKKIYQLFVVDSHVCPSCKTEMSCYGSHPWGYFSYICETCKFKIE